MYKSNNNFNDELNNILPLIEKNDYNKFINYIPKIRYANFLVTTLCEYYNSNWLELAIPRFITNIDKHVIDHNIINLINKKFDMDKLQKIITLQNLGTENILSQNKQLISKMYLFFREQRKNVFKSKYKIIRNDTIFFKIINLLKKFKHDDIKIKGILENVCYIFSIERNIDYKTVLYQMYKFLNLSEFS